VVRFPDTRHVQGHCWSFASTSLYHPQVVRFPDTRHVQGHYWSFGSPLYTILKCSGFQTLGMFKGTTEALVHVSIPSSNVQVSRHLACSKALLKLWFTSLYQPQVVMFPDTRHIQGNYWGFGSRLYIILKWSCFQTLGMFKGTTEALVHVSISSSSGQVSRHLAMVKGF